ncbi:hypothetical protein N0V88_004303 [Collariella sp. IMI 366227]|nr:hypothetical protein N0V88_004303 [Collariella sp. IMI 366227]
MSTQESEKSGAAAVDTMENSEPPKEPAPVKSGRQRDERYLCGCRICFCGAAVEYPGDVCSICSKYL